MAKTIWKKSTGLPEETGRVTIYCPESKVDEWRVAADETGYPSRSRYLFELIEEARAYREKGFLGWEDSQQRIEELEARVDELDSEIESDHAAKPSLSRFQGMVENQMSTKYRPFEKVVAGVVEENSSENVVRGLVESLLYELAEDGGVEYQRGHGWKLTSKGKRDG